MHDFSTIFASKLWPLIGVDWDFYAHFIFVQHEKLKSESQTVLVYTDSMEI